MSLFCRDIGPTSGDMILPEEIQMINILKGFIGMAPIQEGTTNQKKRKNPVCYPPCLQNLS
jgi:hypothetical protein